MNLKFYITGNSPLLVKFVKELAKGNIDGHFEDTSDGIIESTVIISPYLNTNKIGQVVSEKENSFFVLEINDHLEATITKNHYERSTA